MQPRNILIGNLIRDSDRMEVGELIGYLNRFLAAAVITKKEDLRLTNSGVGKAPLDSTIPTRGPARTAGLDPETFHALRVG